MPTPLPPPVIVLPGITAIHLRDEYTLPIQNVWSVLSKDYERVAMHPDDFRYEAVEPALVRPDQVFEVAYRECIEELRYNLRDKEDLPVPVFPFAYDWRMPLVDTERRLADFVGEVIDRTKLLKHYHASGYADHPTVDLVGHSMGGLIIAGYLQGQKGAAPVRKVVSLGSPFRGSFEAVIKILTGTANLGTAPPSSREREAARVTPALYHLIPTFAKGLEITDPALPTTLFDPAAWQPSVIDSVAEFIRLHGLPVGDTKARALSAFTNLLTLARTHAQRRAALRLPDVGLATSDWLAVVGVDAETRVRLKLARNAGKPEFVLSNDDRANRWDAPNAESRRQTGDGTVPYEGAVPDFLGEDNLVCVTPSDFGYWELQDRLLTKAAGFHGMLPTMDMLHRLIVRFLKDRPDKRKNTWGRPAPGVAVKDWKPPLALATP
ncbi:MAG: alpha/beta hydrolase [Planctomycetes bacterium]|nr:alpha/beta hydrolase [Planctomycetota bacterium]